MVFKQTPQEKQQMQLHSAVMYALEKDNPQSAANYLRVYQKDGMSQGDLLATWAEIKIDRPDLPETMDEFLAQYPSK